MALVNRGRWNRNRCWCGWERVTHHNSCNIAKYKAYVCGLEMEMQATVYYSTLHGVEREMGELNYYTFPQFSHEIDETLQNNAYLGLKNNQLVMVVCSIVLKMFWGQ
jgi:hypothetical protein